MILINLILADGSLNKMGLFLGIILGLLLTGILGVVSAIKYLRKGGQRWFYVSLVVSVVLLGFMIVMVRAVGLEHRNYFIDFLIFLTLLSISLLLYRKTNDKPKSVLIYAGFNSAIVSGIIILLGSLFALGFALSFIIYAFASFLFTRSLLAQNEPDNTINVFLKVNAVCLLSFTTVSLLIVLFENELIYVIETITMNLEYYLQRLLYYVAVCNLTTLIAVVFFRNNDHRHDPGQQNSL